LISDSDNTHSGINWSVWNPLRILKMGYRISVRLKNQAVISQLYAPLLHSKVCPKHVFLRFSDCFQHPLIDRFPPGFLSGGKIILIQIWTRMSMGIKYEQLVNS